MYIYIYIYIYTLHINTWVYRLVYIYTFIYMAVYIYFIQPYVGVPEFTSYHKTMIMMTIRAYCIKTKYIYIYIYIHNI